MSPLAWLAFLAAGAVGAPARYLVDGLVADRVEGVFPWGTLAVNATGSLILGLLTGLSLYHAFPTTPKVVLGTGFCGAYTTFSTFAFETMALTRQRDHLPAALNAFGSVAAGVIAATRPCWGTASQDGAFSTVSINAMRRGATSAMTLSRAEIRSGIPSTSWKAER